jgi:hypothetical protein
MDLELRSSERQVYAGDAHGRARLISQKLRSGQIARGRVQAAANAGDAGAKLICPDELRRQCRSCAQKDGGATGCFYCNGQGYWVAIAGLISTINSFRKDDPDLRLCARFACLCLEQVTPEDSPQRGQVLAMKREVEPWINSGSVTMWMTAASRRTSFLVTQPPTVDEQRQQAMWDIARGVCQSHAPSFSQAVSHCYHVAGSTKDSRDWQIRTFCDLMVGII